MSLLIYEEALLQLLAGARPLTEIESMTTFAAAGRVLAAPMVSSIDVPPLDNSSMDGYALRSADVPAPGIGLAVAQRISAGSVGHSLAPGTAARIFTGAPIPAGADAIVMQEMCAHAGDNRVIINHVPKPGDWLRRAGQDIRSGTEIIGAGTRLSPAQLGLAASVGFATLPVYRRLRVALFSTGNELVMPGEIAPEALPPGAIYNSNRYLLRGLLQQLGCDVGDLGIVPDNLAATRAALREAAADHDLILTSGGVSVGEEDHVKPAVEQEGALALWKIAIKPGKPLAFGHVTSAGTQRGQCAFIGLPGNPVSSFVTFVMLVRPFILKTQGALQLTPLALSLRADFDLARTDARREFLRARRNQAGGLDLFPKQDSGVLTSVAWADGLIDNPPGQAIKSGDAVSFLPFSELLY
ncbi:MAG: molybdopterin molybdotransferase MoeA [Proteobacteria bacterium]|nr:molybdopterin molybdotransferase MoeA [Pseudomonadota bacterium]